MSTEYLEINSAFRNRKLYPLPSEFVVEIAQSGSKNNFTANDPDCYSAPRQIWCPTTDFSLNSYFTGIVEPHTFPTPPPNVGNAINRTLLMLRIPRTINFQANQTLGYYNGCVIEFVYYNTIIGLGNSIFNVTGNNVYSNGSIWVAVGSLNNTIAYSLDGINWVGLGTSLFTTSGNGVGWSGNIWMVAGSGSDTIGYSNDGMTWFNNPYNTFVRQIVSNGVMYVSVGVFASTTPNNIVYSINGINWIPTTTNFSVQGNGVSWSSINSRWVVVGDNGINSSILYSNNGIDWLPASSTKPLVGKKVFWGLNKFVAVGTGDFVTTFPLVYSTTGDTWNTPLSGVGSYPNTCNSVFYNSGLWIVVGSGGNTMSSSGDGMTWSVTVGTPFSVSGNGIYNNGTLWVAVGQGTNTVSSSVNGTVWSTGTGNIPTMSGNDVMWNGSNTWVIVGTGTHTLSYSTNGTSWTGFGLSLFDTSGDTISWDGTRWIATGQHLGLNKIIFSYDAITWYELVTKYFTVGKQVVWGNNQCLALGNDSTPFPNTNTLMYSSDGVIYNKGINVFDTQGNNAYFNGTIWVAVGEGSSTIKYSSDGITWNNSSFNFTVRGNGIYYSGGQWVAVGEGTDTIAWSTDGINWTGLGNTIFSVQGYGVIKTTTKWVAVGEGTNSVAYSIDGISWVGVSSSPFIIGKGLFSNDTRLVIVGSGPNTIGYSDITDIYEYERILEWRYLYTDSSKVFPEDIFQVLLYNQVSNFAITSSDLKPLTIRIKDQSVYSNTITSNPNIYIPEGVNSNNYYIDYYIYNQTRNEWLKILYYSGITHIAKLGTTSLTRYISSWNQGDIYVLRKDIPSQVNIISNVFTPTLFQLSPSSSQIDNYYVGSYLRIQNSTVKESRRILDWIPISPVGSVFPYDQPNLVVLESPFTTPVVIGNFYEILDFSIDNEQPFEYAGSLVSHREAVCYDVELLNLVLPNTTLNVGYGSRAVFYPFVYVELTPISNSERQGPITISSNNPNSKRMLFRALVFDTTNETNTPFVRIDGGGMTQRIKLLPNDSYKFSVHLPNGQLFETEIPEYYSPDIPNNLKQISALFALKRVK